MQYTYMCQLGLRQYLSNDLAEILKYKHKKYNGVLPLLSINYMAGHTIITSKISLRQKLQKVGQLVGRTPLHSFANLALSLDLAHGVQVLGKLEWQQIGQSIKARPAYNIIKGAIESGEWHDGLKVLDATSGNMGIAYAAIGAAISMPMTMCIPENASYERKRILTALGAELIYTSPLDATDGARGHALALYRAFPERYYYADQYSNANNWRAHFQSTATEIWAQSNGTVTHFVAGMGSAGTLVGTSRGLKRFNKDIKVVAVQPRSFTHGLEGWQDFESACMPAIYEANVHDEILQIDTEKAYEWMQLIARTEGLFVSPSAAANVAAAFEVAARLTQGNVVTTLSDTADKYNLITQKLFKW